jgi:hypothetical protein
VDADWNAALPRESEEDEQDRARPRSAQQRDPDKQVGDGMRRSGGGDAR